MGGKSSSQTQQSQQSTTAPWQPAQGLLQSILGNLNGQLSNTGINPTQTGAINSIEANAGNFNQFNPQITSFIGNLLNGGGANGQAGNLQTNLSTFKNQLTPYANGSMMGQNSALQPYLDTIASDASNNIRGQYAAAGRDFSPAEARSVARGVMEGQAPVVANQYNADVANRIGAANSLYGAGNTTAGLLTGLNQTSLGNQQAGIGAIPGALSTQNAGSQSLLEAEAQRLGIPVQNLGLLAQIGIPIAGLGSQSQGTGTSNTTNQMSGADQFLKIAQGIGSFIPKGPMSFSF